MTCKYLKEKIVPESIRNPHSFIFVKKLRCDKLATGSCDLDNQRACYYYQEGD